jgi:hypothetical protein
LNRFVIVVFLSTFLSVNAQTVYSLKNAWGNIDSDIAPWACNVSRPNKIKSGLEGRHISLWASHGRFFDIEKGKWKWQRPNLFCTNEDLFTQTIVVPYLIPMLENAGAYVFTPRERDWQKNEIIIDNDYCLPAGSTFINSVTDKWYTTTGFSVHEGEYYDGENPFKRGTAVVTKAAKPKKASFFYYIPRITEAGRYAVYVSYPQLKDAVDDVLYIVRHKGIQTEFVVNQQIGYSTWVYLGTFDFDVTPPGDFSKNNCVILSTASKHKGHIGADAVRLGGGMGNIQRNGLTSGMPRCFEGARYYCQWAGAPYSVYSDKLGENDYADDINARSLIGNWLGGGSCYMPSLSGEGVPFELSLAIHSDAGYQDDGNSIYGSLAIATTNFNDGILSSGVSRQTSLDFASQLLSNLNTDMRYTFGKWDKRYLWDRNYSETRIPEIPSAILETLSHQNFPDMVIGQHPFGKFCIARSIYKTILKYICEQHGEKFVVTPLAPIDFRIELIGNNKIELSWTGVKDSRETTSAPTSYNLYTSIGSNDFDNGQNVKSTKVNMTLEPGMQYNFKVTACNDGGESFSTETLSAYISEESLGTIIVVNGFERLSAPHIIDNDLFQGFDLAKDEGVQRGLYAGWCGRQINFSKYAMGGTDELGLGFSGSELEGQFIAGNDFNYVVDHVRAIASTKKYNVVSTSLSAVNKQMISFDNYSMVDIAFGLQKDDGQLNLHYKTFSNTLRNKLEIYANKGGAIMTSGSFIGSDMLYADEPLFLKRVLKTTYFPSSTELITDTITGLGLQYEIYKSLNDKHYAATHPEVLSPVEGGICAMQYSDGTSAAVGYKGKFSCFSMGFPFECIKGNNTKDKIMQRIINYLLK